MDFKKRGICLVFIILLVSLGFVVALSPEAISVGQNLEKAKTDMQELQNKDFNVIRYNDTLITTQEIYGAKLELESQGDIVDYSNVMNYIEELSNIKQLAIKTFDELQVLKLTIEESRYINGIEEVDLIYIEAEEAFRQERYEDSLELIDQTYEKLSEIEAVDTKIKATYEAARRGFVNLIKDNWKEIGIGFLVLIILYFLFHRRIEIKIVNKKIARLERQKESIKTLMSKTQGSYFNKGDMDDNTYQIRMKRYAEITRDLNRQIPLLKERLARVSKKASSNNNHTKKKPLKTKKGNNKRGELIGKKKK